MKSIKEWLNEIGHEEYFQRFADSKINMDVLPDLVEDDLEKLDIPLGDRKRILPASRARAVQPAGCAAGARPPAPARLPAGPHCVARLPRVRLPLQTAAPVVLLSAPSVAALAGLLRPARAIGLDYPRAFHLAQGRQWADVSTVRL